MTRRWTQPQHQPNPGRLARQAAEEIKDRADWWVAARDVKRRMRRSMRHDPSAGLLWRQARAEFRHLATRRGIENLREAP